MPLFTGVVEPIGRFVLKHSPRLSGLRRLPLVGGVLSRIAARALPRKERVWIRLESGVGQGLWFRLNPRTQFGFYEAEHDLALRRLMETHLKQGMVVYDLGANLGLFALVAAQLVGPTGRVFAFEPEPELAGRIEEHLARNGLQNVRLIPCAAWSTTGFVPFARDHHSDSSDYGLGRIAGPAVPAADANPPFVVPCIALDDFAEKEAPPDFIKCDVEGAEVEVFEGARRTLARRRPVVECEVHSAENGNNVGGILYRDGL